MKKIISIITMFSILIVCFAGCNNTVKIENKNITENQFVTKDNLDGSLKAHDTFTLIEQNEYLELYANGKTTEIAIKDKASGKMWYSNPTERQNDAVATGANKGKLGSQLELEYYNETDKVNTMDNANDCILLGQFVFSKISGGFRVTYTIGEMKKTYLVPSVITKDRFEKLILNRLEDSDKEIILKRYKIVTLNGISDNEVKKTLLKQFPLLEKSDLYVLPDNMSDFALEKLSETLSKTGYNKEDLVTDNNQNKIEMPKPSTSFEIPVDYTIESKNFVAKINASNIKQDTDVKLTKLTFLKYFGAAGKDESGYIFVPDGSGALIHLNNGKTRYGSYSQQIYGVDKTINVTEKGGYEEQCYLPVYGMKNSNSAFYVIVEKGEAIGQINASVSGTDSSYNIVYPTFALMEHDNVKLSFMNNQGVNMYQPEPFGSDIQLRFSFLNDDKANYAEMAIGYQKYLLDNSLIKRSSFQRNVPLFLSVIGAIDYNSSMLGIPITTTKPLTTFGEAKNILEELNNMGVGNIALRYTAWMNGGRNNYISSSVDIVDKLGGMAKLKDLNNYMGKNNLELYPDVDLQYVKNDKIFDSFNSYVDASKNIIGEIAYDYEYNLSTNKKNNSTKRFIISPRKYDYFINSFIRNYKKLNIQGISLSGFSNDINSDYNKASGTNRQQSEEIMINQFKKFDDNQYRMILDGANAFTLKYANKVANVPTGSSDFYIEDEEVPFYQIVLHGILPYSGKPLNLSSSYDDEVLKCIETGSSPFFEFIYKDNYEIKDTDYNNYAISYNPWKKVSVSTYKKLNDVLSAVQEATIAEHGKITDKVYKTTYSNGVSIYVNYNSEESKINSVVIPSKGFVVQKEDENNAKN